MYGRAHTRAAFYLEMKSSETNMTPRDEEVRAVCHLAIRHKRRLCHLGLLAWDDTVPPWNPDIWQQVPCVGETM
ncbi:hypothetical protein NDU88_008713 [Pleurodeles waltl]|uniref:Uncharacterized protein n=1 Tax=Pleurodeles waltl TaxID=8319 RepID=A0AAV7N9W6_PLEWA|nr:hypothetical protein NDU88_008713 [Pleurodeles waltl]